MLPATADAKDAADFDAPQPLAGLRDGLAFFSDEDMKQALPPPVFNAYLKAVQQLHSLVEEDKRGGDGDETPVRLPWRSYSPGASAHAARDAAGWLGRVVEAAETQRAHLR